ncbi:protein-glutamate O-methyltransferase CheR [Hyphomicrobium sp. LHD-15]|uniref:CheR family methyltransferase n=1 Tax=Hyphomicrobium sp. LHD-15 TaxID=3072142 RepID=UPI00280DCB03|nr:protein-glutamate O-methyltransferase CheR [Hyphomicrobium sp. LHD-15]MDQ8699101.1 protein-glutamate O-methyltransferase CheR [Hyphomicrobium sp. LHD-15]
MSQAFDALCEFLRRSSGLVMEQSKKYLVESRVMPIVRREKLSGLEELVLILQKGQSPKLAKDVIEAMTINETYFFRDKGPFDQFRSVMLPAMIAARQSERRLRIWSAAASTGQEAYSLAMIIEEQAAKLAGWKIEILGTDLSDQVLDKARKGIYSQFEVQRGLPTPMLLRHFNQIGDSWQISDAMRSKATFRQMNLLADYTSLGRFDIIFCRNVLIYFDAARKMDILGRMSRILAPDGFLTLGASESLIGLKTDLVAHPEHRGIFQRNGAGAPIQSDHATRFATPPASALPPGFGATALSAANRFRTAG